MKQRTRIYYTEAQKADIQLTLMAVRGGRVHEVGEEDDCETTLLGHWESLLGTNSGEDPGEFQPQLAHTASAI